MPKPRGRASYDDVVVHCVVCAQVVPPERRKYKAITCSDECAWKRKYSLRARQDARECRYCRKPSTLEDRIAYARFRRLERKRPDLLWPERFEEWKQAQAEDLQRLSLDKVYKAFAKAFWGEPQPEATPAEPEPELLPLEAV